MRGWTECSQVETDANSTRSLRITSPLAQLVLGLRKRSDEHLKAIRTQRAGAERQVRSLLRVISRWEEVRAVFVGFGDYFGCDIASVNEFCTVIEESNVRRKYFLAGYDTLETLNRGVMPEFFGYRPVQHIV